MNIKVNSRIFYPSHGAGHIVGTKTIDFAGQALNYYEITFLNNDITVSAPVATIENLGVRLVETPDRITEVIKTLKKTPSVKPKIADYNELMEEIKVLDGEGKISNFVEIIQLCNFVKDKRLSEGKLIPVSVNRYLRSSINHLVSELAVSSAQSFEKAKDDFESLTGLSVKN